MNRTKKSRVSFLGQIVASAAKDGDLPRKPIKSSFSAGVTLLGGGPCESDDLRQSLAPAPHLVAADGGAEHAVAMGVIPDLIIGDMDSLTAETRASIPVDRQIAVADQDTTDFQKCLDRIDAPLVLALGMWGGRADHTMAAMHALVASDAPCIVLGSHDVIFAATTACRLDLPVGARVSLFPMNHVTGQSSGLHWPIDDLTFSPFGRIGTSNRATGPVELFFDGPGMLIVLGRVHLDHAIRAVHR